MPKKEIQTAIEHKQCPVCGDTHTFECGILVSKKPMVPFEEPVVTGPGLCEKHTELFNKGFVALVEAHNKHKASVLSPREVILSGNVAHIKREALIEILEVEIEEDTPLIYCGLGTITHLKELKDAFTGSTDLH